MQLIADSGSTKTQWCLLQGTEVVKEIFTEGINPFYQDEAQIRREIAEIVVPQFSEVHEIAAVHFYGAGCAFPDKKRMVSNAIHSSFAAAEIEVNNDLLAACRALFGTEAGIACILGTGSNSCLYNGHDIEENVSPLGFILGDEGSGAAIGKRFIADLLKNQYPEELSAKFFEQHHITPADIMEAVYRKPFPNRFLAQFTYFMHSHQEEIHIREMVYHSFVDFFTRNIHQYDYQRYTVACMGSVAFYFEKILREAGIMSRIKIGKVIKGPMNGLIDYHTK
ncbi:MAG: ATPase [Prevotellaceae bacterium]|nr:ATPase [Prevotellaceae bacterium]